MFGYRWLPDVNAIVYIGNKQSRETLQEFEFYGMVLL